MHTSVLGDEKPPKVNYTIPGVLHFIQHEWSKFEMEKGQWEVEKAELRARIAFLQGERKGQENLKNDLVRRIKMLEYALQQERLKMARLLHGTNDAAEPGSTSTAEIAEVPAEDQQIPTDVDSVIYHSKSNYNWRQGRQLLRQYLQEIGYTDTILDVRSMRARSLLGLTNDGQASSHSGSSSSKNFNDMYAGDAASAQACRDYTERVAMDSEQSVLATMDFLKSSTAAANTPTESEKSPTDLLDEENESDSGDEDDLHPNSAHQFESGRKSADMGGLEIAEEEALAEFKFFPGGSNTTDEADSKSSRRANDIKEGDDWTNVDYKAVNKKKAEFQKEVMSKKDVSRRVPRTELEAMINLLGAEENQPSTDKEASDVSQMLQDMDATLGRLGLGDLANLSNVDEVDPVAHDVTVRAYSHEESLRRSWVTRFTLRNHLDSVRAIAFHPVEAVLITASEDATMKLWNLQKTLSATSSNQNAKKAASHDLEPVYTFRGHSGPVLSMCLSPTGDYCYTGSLDGTVRCWMMPSPSVDLYDTYDKSVLSETFRGHSDAVWSVAFHSSDNRLISASADGTVKIWEPSVAQPLLKTYVPDNHEGSGVPTSVDFMSTDPQQAVAAYTSGSAFIYDLETGRTVLSFDTGVDEKNTTAAAINCILSHPTLPMTITAHNDKTIRFFDNCTGKIIDLMNAHLDAVTCLSVDPNGLYLLSGSHDGSLRLWNLDTKTCLQEITAHRKKFDESVFAVAFHASRPLIASGGADALTKVFTQLSA
ncbi:unnamed protein product [Soboliphyme baturini]|uniref:WD_REPEATS_REGION domain-containing protein n=1 Tax=Soboliphyme baturini TaxID=241478 RepID=A0A183IPK3_9BILA|nr:unnamed protein product [Soboliphyme baturini]